MKSQAGRRFPVLLLRPLHVISDALSSRSFTTYLFPQHNFSSVSIALVWTWLTNSSTATPWSCSTKVDHRRSIRSVLETKLLFRIVWNVPSALSACDHKPGYVGLQLFASRRADHWESTAFDSSNTRRLNEFTRDILQNAVPFTRLIRHKTLFLTRQIISSLCLMQILTLFNHAYAEDSVWKQNL